jgi:isopropanol dehydrogenase (NADP+)
MKGFAMKKIGEVGWIEKERPACGPNDAICRPLALAPCTSDIHTVFEGAIGDRHNMILGHEALGIVDEVGSEVRDFKPGDRVIVPAITPDWGEEAEQRGFPSQTTGPCGGWKFSNFKDGVFAEYFHVNQADANLALLPEGMSLEAAVMIPDMLSTGFMGAENANIPIGGTVAVLGIGPVGLCGIAGAKLRGAGRIFAVGTRGQAHRGREGLRCDRHRQLQGRRHGRADPQGDQREGRRLGHRLRRRPRHPRGRRQRGQGRRTISNNNYFGKGMFDKDYLPIPARAGASAWPARTSSTASAPAARSGWSGSPTS